MRDTRTLNLVGALVLALHDEMEAATTRAAEHSAAYPAALATIYGSPGLSIEALRQILGLTHSGTVRLLDALEREGSVVRKAGKDARSVAIELTAGGKRQALAVLRAREQALAPALDGLSAAERAQLLHLTEKLLGHLTRSPQHADAICRLCDLGACPGGSCPVECAAHPA